MMISVLDKNSIIQYNVVFDMGRRLKYNMDVPTKND